MLQFDKPTLITITAPSGSGKSYLLDELVRRSMIKKIVSTTTRPPRPGEKEGEDYYFISEEESKKAERDGRFFELAVFQGIRYGVLNSEMENAMTAGPAPVVLVEPTGLVQYQEACAQRGWHTFQVYVHVAEPVRIARLNKRTTESVLATSVNLRGGTSRYADAFESVAVDLLREKINLEIETHTKRLQGIMTDERSWSNRFNWDAIVPGDNVESAISLMKQGVSWRNKRYLDVKS